MGSSAIRPGPQGEKRTPGSGTSLGLQPSGLVILWRTGLLYQDCVSLRWLWAWGRETKGQEFFGLLGEKKQPQDSKAGRPWTSEARALPPLGGGSGSSWVSNSGSELSTQSTARALSNALHPSGAALWGLTSQVPAAPCAWC